MGQLLALKAMNCVSYARKDMVYMAESTSIKSVI